MYFQIPLYKMDKRPLLKFLHSNVKFCNMWFGRISKIFEKKNITNLTRLSLNKDDANFHFIDAKTYIFYLSH